MTLGRRFLLYLVLVHLAFAAGAIVFLRDHRPWLLALEAFFALSLAVGLRLTRAATLPARLLRHASQSLAEGDFTTRLRPVGGAEMDALIDVYNRMADHLRQERIHNEEQEHFLRGILNASPLGMITLDMEGAVSALNPAAEALLGAREAALRGRRLAELGTPFARALAELPVGVAQVVPLQGPRRVRCQKLGFLDRGFTRHCLLLEEMTDELRRSEKQAYERLIRIMAHEVNNTGGAVSSLLQSCRHYADQIDPVHRADFAGALDVAGSRLNHMSAFMNQFADVVRLPAPRRAPTALPALLERVQRLMAPECAKRAIAFELSIAPQLPEVSLDAIQLEQVLLNILKNAIESIGENGRITLKLDPTPAGPRLTLTDTGPGIPPDLKDQLFTPFFTTKEYGQGIGLTLVREILVAHAFPFSLESRDGVTEFVILFATR